MESQTSTPLMHLWFPCAARDFPPRANFQCRLCYGVHTPLCAIACISICAHVKHPVAHVTVVDYGHTETPSMHCRLGSMTVAAGFPREKQPRFFMGEIPVGNTVIKKWEAAYTLDAVISEVLWNFVLRGPSNWQNKQFVDCCNWRETQ